MLADFVTKRIRKESNPISDVFLGKSKPSWVLYIDGSTNRIAAGAGIILEGPEGVTVEHWLCFDF